MLLVPSYVAPSTINGYGCFAADGVRKGSVVWRYEPLVDITIDQEAYSAMSHALRACLAKYGWRSGDVRYLAGDNARFINHQAFPNLVEDPATGDMIAASDIQLAEELTENYSYDDDFDSYAASLI